MVYDSDLSLLQAKVALTLATAKLEVNKAKIRYYGELAYFHQLQSWQLATQLMAEGHLAADYNIPVVPTLPSTLQLPDIQNLPAPFSTLYCRFPTAATQAIPPSPHALIRRPLRDATNTVPRATNDSNADITLVDDAGPGDKESENREVE